LGKDANAAYKEYEVELTEESKPAETSSEVNLEDEEPANDDGLEDVHGSENETKSDL